MYQLRTSFEFLRPVNGSQLTFLLLSYEPLVQNSHN